MATFSLHKDQLVECPYDKNHKIAVRNQIKHIIECQKKSDSKFSVCVYNASHRMARHEFAQHVRSCPDGRQYQRETYVRQQTSCSINSKVGSNHSIDSQIESNCLPIDEPLVTSEENNEDNWDEDNCPNYSIYNDMQTSLTPESQNLENKTKKLTKNQKKRNRRKAAIGSKQNDTEINSIWD